MVALSEIPAPATRRLRLQTLSRLRWLAVVGQAGTILGVYYGLGFQLPLGPCLLLVALSACLNIVLRIRYAASHRLSPVAAAVLLLYDTIQLAALLYFTGGLTNPFSLLLIVPVVVSASALEPRITIALGLLVLLASAVLGLAHWPLPWFEGETVMPRGLYVAGVWAGLAACTAFVGIYAWRISAESLTLASALSAAELALAREHHLSTLDGLAAATAHELGTPLATIHLVAGELAKELPADSPLADDIGLLVTQSKRCREILSKLGSLEGMSEGPLGRVALPVLVDEIAGPHRGFGVTLAVRAEGEGDAPTCRRDPAIMYGLGNIVENATDFAETAVGIHIGWDAQKITITIADDGPGFPLTILDKLGDPYIGRRKGRHAHAGGARDNDKGLGLGVFIAKTLLERTGASLRFENMVGGGASVRIVWPRRLLEAPAT
ncbi:MAG: ActS/PrrB/RegB family redox-sensitive histidine kinase [Flavobacteriaceae bacterium]